MKFLPTISLHFLMGMGTLVLAAPPKACQASTKTTSLHPQPTLAPCNPACATGYTCKRDPRALCSPGSASCASICVPSNANPQKCKTGGGQACGAGQICIKDPHSADGLPEICVTPIKCGGFTFPPLPNCAAGTVCVDDPTDTCDRVLVPDCLGICV